MKILIASLLLASFYAPAVLAMEGSLDLIVSETAISGGLPPFDEFGRRSGQCPSRGAIVALEGSTCGGV